MNKSLRRSAVILSACISGGLALPGLTGCVQDPAPFDPRAAQQWELREDYQVKPRPMYPLPTTQNAQFVPESADAPATQPTMPLNVPEGPPVRMSLEEVVHRTIANNMEIRVASYDTAIDQTRILEAEANFDPSFFADVSFQRVDKMTAGTESAVVAPNVDPNTNNATSAFPRNIVVRFDQEQLFTSDIGIRQNLPSGGKIELKQEVDNSWFNPPRAILRSYYESDLVLTLTQPLLQNFGVAVNRARITIAQNNSRVSLMDFRKTVEDTVLKVEQVYWQEVQAQRDVEAIQKFIDESMRLRTILSHRYGTDVTNGQIEQVTADIAQRQATLIQLHNHVADLSDQLKQLMNDPSYPVTGACIIIPADPGTEVPLHFNLDDQVETAMQNRYELGQQQARIDSAEIAVDVARNNRLPSLTAQLVGTVDGLQHDIGAAFAKEGDFNHLGYQFGLQLEVPLGNRAAAAIWQRSLMQRMQAIASYAGLVNNIALDVKTAARKVDESWQFLLKSRESRLKYQLLLDNIRSQYEVGDQPLTFETVYLRLQYQQSLFQAQTTEDQALNDYNFAIASLEKAKGTILRYNNVMLEQEMLPFDMAVKGNPIPERMLLGTTPDMVQAPVIPITPPLTQSAAK